MSLPDDSGVPQTLAVFGDQGLYPYSSVGNLIDDARAGWAAGGIQGVLHLGDLSYNMAMANGTRGEARRREPQASDARERARSEGPIVKPALLHGCLLLSTLLTPNTNPVCPPTI